MSSSGRTNFRSKASSSFVDLFFSRRRGHSFASSQPPDGSRAQTHETKESSEGATQGAFVNLARNKTLPTILKQRAGSRALPLASKPVRIITENLETDPDNDNHRIGLLSPLLSRGLAAIDKSSQSLLLPSEIATSRGPSTSTNAIVLRSHSSIPRHVSDTKVTRNNETNHTLPRFRSESDLPLSNDNKIRSENQQRTKSMTLGNMKIACEADEILV